MIKTFYLSIVILLCCSNLLFAQDNPPAWGGGADQKDMSFGFSFSFVNNYYKIDKKADWQTPFLDPENSNKPVTSQLNGITSKNSPGFAVGFLTRYSFTDHIEARVTPSLIFADRTIDYTFLDPNDNVTKSVQTTTADFPLLFKLKSDRIGNYRAYLLAGAKYSYSLGAKKNDDEAALIDKNVKNLSAYVSYDVGIGMDIYFEYFKLSPEIKLSNSFGNMLYPENQPFSAPISKLSLHTVMFSLIFE